jgi:UDP-N-acetyl-D-galactosamine dehydrogenase
VLGLTFKEDCNDIRNSKVPDILRELRSFGIEPLVHDPLAHPGEATHEYGLHLAPIEELQKLDALVLAVSHKWYLDRGTDRLLAPVRDGGIVVDVKSALDPKTMKRGLRYWSL